MRGVCNAHGKAVGGCKDCQKNRGRRSWGINFGSFFVLIGMLESGWRPDIKESMRREYLGKSTDAGEGR